MQPTDSKWMGEALKLAEQAGQMGEVPVGAVVVFEDRIVGYGYNCRESDKNPLAHAEIIAIEEAARNLGRWRLFGCTLYVTLEPCPMCAGALVNARMDRLVYGAMDIKSRFNHQVMVEGGVLAEQSAELLKSFFQKLRSSSN